MRLLILLSAFLTALTGAISGVASAAQPVQASATVQVAKPPIAPVAALLVGAQAGLLPGLPTWYVADAVVQRQNRAPFGERRRL